MDSVHNLIRKIHSRSIWPVAFLLVMGTAGPAQERPEARAHHQLVYAAGEQRVLLLGGSTPRGDGHHFFDDIWSWSRGRWERVDSLPFPRSSHRVVHDTRNDRIVLFGGGSGRTFTADGTVWAWGGATWSRIGESHWGGLAEPGMCYDEGRGRIVLFGGWDGENRFHGETWEWTGDALVRLSATGPSARAGHAFVYDPAGEHCMLFGGRSDGGVLADTWAWDGAAWHRLEAAGPSARWIAAAASDPAHDRIVVFGGWTEDEVLLDDTWAWDGSRWQLVTRVGPPPRISGQMAFDGEGMLLFGGRTRTAEGFRDLGDTWRLRGRTWVRGGGPGM